MFPAPDGYIAVFTDADGKEVRRAPVLAWDVEGGPRVPSVPVFRELSWANEQANIKPDGTVDYVGGRMPGEVFARLEGPSASVAANAATQIGWVVLIHRADGDVDVLGAAVLTSEDDARKTLSIVGDGEGNGRGGERYTIATVTGEASS